MKPYETWMLVISAMKLVVILFTAVVAIIALALN